MRHGDLNHLGVLRSAPKIPVKRNMIQALHSGWHGERETFRWSSKSCTCKKSQPLRAGSAPPGSKKQILRRAVLRRRIFDFSGL